MYILCDFFSISGVFDVITIVRVKQIEDALDEEGDNDIEGNYILKE